MPPLHSNNKTPIVIETCNFVKIQQENSCKGEHEDSTLVRSDAVNIEVNINEKE